MNNSLGFTTDGFLALIFTTWAAVFAIINKTDRVIIDLFRWLWTHRPHRPPVIRIAIGNAPTLADAARQNR